MILSVPYLPVATQLLAENEKLTDPGRYMNCPGTIGDVVTVTLGPYGSLGPTGHSMAKALLSVEKSVTRRTMPHNALFTSNYLPKCRRAEIL
jgi:hypothetical protein